MEPTSALTGIDLSLRSPGVCIINKTDKHVHFWTIKQRVSDHKHISTTVTDGLYDTYQLTITQCEMPGTLTNVIQRATYVAEAIRDQLIKHGVTKVKLEGYAYSKFTRGASAIKELTGILKYLLGKAEITIDIVSPTQLKRKFTGKGNVKKQAMYTRYLEYKLPDLFKVMNIKPSKTNIKAPISDMVDAFALAVH